MSQDQATITNPNPLVDTKEFKFRFKKDKLGNQRPTVELKLPVPSVEGLIAVITAGGKALDLLLEVCADQVRSVAASLVSDDEKASQDNFPFDKITWDAIANAPRAERRSIADEVWEGFCADYIATMPAVTGKSIEAVTNATVVFIKKFAMIKTNKNVLAKLQEQLALYIEHSKNAEQFAEVTEMLMSKAEAYLKSDDVEALISSL